MDDLLSTRQAAAILNLSTRRVRQLCEGKRIGRKVGGAYVMTRRELAAFATIKRPCGNHSRSRKPTKPATSTAAAKAKRKGGVK